jgi:RHS repeat-associated protein
VGNRLSQNSTIAGIPTGTFGYDADDRLSTEQYDNNGNTTVSGARTFAYDFENRLKSMNNGAVTMLYDADGNRVGKNTTRYLVDELNPTGYAQVVEELTGSTVTRRYTYGLQRISQTQSGTTSFYGYDGFGSVRQLTDSTGAVTDTYDYDAWGNTVNVTGSIPNVYRYRGEQYDADLNLYYLRARYFNPLAGRFLARDSASGEVLNPSSWHKYIYAVADPIDRSDPSGQQAIFEDTILTSTRTVAWQVASAALIAGTIACIWMKAADWLEVASLVPVSGVRQTRCHVRARRSDEDPDANAMRVQLQEGNRTLATVPKMNYSDPGVTVGQMREALQQLWDQGARQIPVSARPRFRSAIIETSLQYGLYPPGGVSKGGRFYYREFNDDRGVTYRVDSDNLRGTNLRE